MKFQSSRDRDEKLERLEWESIKHRQSSKRVLIFHPVSVLLVGRCEKVSFSSSEAIHERTMKKDRVLRFKGCFSWNFLSFYEAWNFCVIKKSRTKAPTKATVEHGRVSFICPEQTLLCSSSFAVNLICSRHFSLIELFHFRSSWMSKHRCRRRRYSTKDPFTLLDLLLLSRHPSLYQSIHKLARSLFNLSRWIDLKIGKVGCLTHTLVHPPVSPTKEWTNNSRHCWLAKRDDSHINSIYYTIRWKSIYFLDKIYPLARSSSRPPWNFSFLLVLLFFRASTVVVVRPLHSSISSVTKAVKIKERKREIFHRWSFFLTIEHFPFGPRHANANISNHKINTQRYLISSKQERAECLCKLEIIERGEWNR